MSNKFHVLDHPMLLYAGFATSGHTKDLQPGIIGLFDDKSRTAVTAATINSHRPVMLAQGSYHTKDALGTFYTGLKKSTKTADFLPQDVMHIEYSPFRNSQNEKWIFGFDGLNTESINWECGKTHKFRIRVYGEGVYNDFQKQILRDIQVTTACCDSDECAEGCPDGSLHCQKYTEELINKINSDVEISKYVRAEIVLASANLRVDSQTHKSLTLEICDNGDQEALNDVQRAYPTLSISRIARVGGISTYSTECLLNATANAVGDFTPTASVFLSVCNECEAGYTLVGARQRYTIIRNIADYSTTADVIADYAVLDTATIPTADVNIGTDTFTEVAHNFVTGQRVKYQDGGGAAITELTDNTVYYIIKLTADTFKVAATAADAFAGTAIAISGTGNNAQTFEPWFTVTLLEQTPTTAILELTAEEGATVTAVDAGNGTDIVIPGNLIPAQCSATAASPVAWDDADLFYTTTRTMKATISKTCGGKSRLAEIQAFYADQTNLSVALTTTGDCEDVYTITQTSECMSAGECLSQENPMFATVAPFEGIYWEVVESVVAPSDTFYCGIRLEVSSNYNRFGDCSWVPEDYYTFKPTMMEIYQVEEDGAPCKAQVPARKLQNAIQKSQSGEWVAREYIKLAAYLYMEAFDSDPRLREILDQTIYQIIDKNAFYNVYYIKFKQYRSNNVAGNTQNPEIYEIPIVVKNGVDTTAFETWLNTLFAPFGVSVKPRTDQANY